MLTPLNIEYIARGVFDFPLVEHSTTGSEFNFPIKPWVKTVLWSQLKTSAIFGSPESKGGQWHVPFREFEPSDSIN